MKIDDLWKRFPLRRDRPGFKEFIVNIPHFLQRNQDSYFWALKGINIGVKEGECLGVIGRNGGGKSTLLSLILGTMYPTKGNIKVSKKMTPLLELGAGFHPDITGRENILINGVLLGLMRDEVIDRMDDIISYSEIGDFVDIPVRTYSTGMYLRLAFSIAIYTDPELLLIDEILSVGDEFFQKKSKNTIIQLIKGGVTTILVSHNLAAVKEMCNRTIWLDNGEITAEGETEKVLEGYLRNIG
ncbi:MAG: ABC transporter ATP-binding protein [Candidatus Hodarchaeota archaeon]